MKICKPPEPFEVPEGWPSIFLAGSIEMDRAEPWQRRVHEAFEGVDVVLLNPRRDSWDASWVQRLSNPHFRGQVEWELEGLEQASWVLMHFDPATKSPISLLELGLLASSGRLAVSCPDGFWRKGNVEVVCARYGVPLFDGLDPLIAHIKAELADGPS